MRPRFRPEPFVPAWGLSSPHAQTAFAALYPSSVPLLRERWPTPDGDFLDVDLFEMPPERPHVLVLHGLEGSSRRGYVARLIDLAGARGWGAIAVNFRSCTEPNVALESYNAGDTADARWALGRIRERVRGPIVAVGFSLGANVLLRLLGEDGDDCPLEAAAAISAPYDLSICSRAIDAPQSLLYRSLFLRTLKAKALEKARRYPGRIDAERVRRAKTLTEFDDAVTARLWGFASAEAYYRACSSAPLLWRVRRPTLLVSSADDPIVPRQAFPHRELERNPHLLAALTERGGHVGFVSGSLVRPAFWAEAQAVAFLACALTSCRDR